MILETFELNSETFRLCKSLALVFEEMVHSTVFSNHKAIALSRVAFAINITILIYISPRLAEIILVYLFVMWKNLLVSWSSRHPQPLSIVPSAVNFVRATVTIIFSPFSASTMSNSSHSLSTIQSATHIWSTKYVPSILISSTRNLPLAVYSWMCEILSVAPLNGVLP